ncbi:hypothetical protein [Streptomyces xanthochromogenes]|uniref:hypothetical protein n=1 Tax=Streptomyces xanthochromogenes TaxID=67384 RepID=UPI002F40D3FC
MYDSQATATIMLLGGAVVAVVGCCWFKWKMSRVDVTPPGPPAPYTPPEPGLVAPDDLRTDWGGPDEEADDALRAAESGNWHAAADLLSRTGQEWDLRSRRAKALGAVAAQDDGWLLNWRAQRPGDADAALVHAHAMVVLAWLVRGSLGSEHTTREQFDGFHRVLHEARDACAEAVALADPDDPSPYIAELLVARGLMYPHEEFRSLWAEVVARAPHHYDAHFTALQYWCAKWRGSQELAEEFATTAAQSAPPGSLLRVLPVVSWYEHHVSDADSERFLRPEIVARVEALSEDVAAAPADHPWLPSARHALAYFLPLQGRSAEALPHFRAVDGWTGTFPWAYLGEGRYVAARDEAFRSALTQV